MKAAKINKGENTNKPTSDIVMSDDLFNIIKDTYLDIHEAMVATAFFKRNNMEYKDILLNAEPKKVQLEFGIPEEDLIKIED